MTYRVFLSKAIRKQLRNLPGNVRNVARKQIISLAEQPRPQNAKELEGHPDYYRMWIMEDLCVIHERWSAPFVVSLSNHDMNPSTSSGRTVCTSLYQRS